MSPQIWGDMRYFRLLKAGATLARMCDPYSMTKGQTAILELARAMHDRLGRSKFLKQMNAFPPLEERCSPSEFQWGSAP